MQTEPGRRSFTARSSSLREHRGDVLDAAPDRSLRSCMNRLNLSARRQQLPSVRVARRGGRFQETSASGPTQMAAIPRDPRVPGGDCVPFPITVGGNLSSHIREPWIAPLAMRIAIVTIGKGSSPPRATCPPRRRSSWRRTPERRSCRPDRRHRRRRTATPSCSDRERPSDPPATLP